MRESVQVFGLRLAEPASRQGVEAGRIRFVEIFPVVKSRINARFRRNSNRLFIFFEVVNIAVKS